MEKGQAAWTWLVYMAGDNNLEGAGRDDMEEMARVGSTKDVNVVVQFDTEQNRTYRYRIEKDKLTKLQTMPGVNCGDAEVLSAFLQWGLATFPAANYLVDVWNHGGGWENLPADFDYAGMRSPRTAARVARARRSLFRTTPHRIAGMSAAERAIAIDCGSSDYLDNQELERALRDGLGGKKAAILGCDACLMSQLEVVYQVRDCAEVFVGSEETEPGAGWAYAPVLEQLVANPRMKAQEVAAAIAGSYADYYQEHHQANVTQSAIALGGVTRLAAAVDSLATKLTSLLPGSRDPIELARGATLAFDIPEYLDLGDFCAQLQKRLPAAAGEAGAVLTALRSAVLTNAHLGSSMEVATGLSIYFPAGKRIYSADYDEIAFGKSSRWPEFLKKYLGR